MTPLHNTNGKRRYQMSMSDGEERTNKRTPIWAVPWAAYS